MLRLWSCSLTFLVEPRRIIPNYGVVGAEREDLMQRVSPHWRQAREIGTEFLQAVAVRQLNLMLENFLSHQTQKDTSALINTSDSSQP